MSAPDNTPLAQYTTYELRNERQRLQGALTGKDLANASENVRTLLSQRLAAVEAEQESRSRHGATLLDRYMP